MNEKLEKQIACHLLQHKEHGYSVLYILRKSAIRYLILFAFLGCCVILNRSELLPDTALILVTGIFIGALARDDGWIRQGKRIWPFYEKAIDWTKVEKIAETKELPTKP